MKKNRIAILLMVVLFAQSSITVYADTDEDLLEIYGKSSQSLIRQNIESQILDIEQDIDSIEKIKADNEKYNALVDEYNMLQEEQYDLINNTISSYAERNNSIKETFSEDLGNMSIADLKKLDSEFKANVNKMNEIVGTMNNVTFVTDYRNTDFDLSDMYLTVDSLWSQWDTAIDAENIGDVKNIKWIMDNEYHVTSSFGYRVDPISGSKISYHSGTDFRCAEGTPVGALFDGEVIDTSYSASSGYYVTVQASDRVKYYYCHLKDVYVEKGDKVKQYDIIATTGNTGYRSTGPHLHLSLYINGAVYDVRELFE